MDSTQLDAADLDLCDDPYCPQCDRALGRAIAKQAEADDAGSAIDLTAPAQGDR